MLFCEGNSILVRKLQFLLFWGLRTTTKTLFFQEMLLWKCAWKNRHWAPFCNLTVEFMKKPIRALILTFIMLIISDHLHFSSLPITEAPYSGKLILVIVPYNYYLCENILVFLFEWKLICIGFTILWWIHSVLVICFNEQR